MHSTACRWWVCAKRWPSCAFWMKPRCDDLMAEDPDLLRSRSPELVTRMLLTDDELQRALARVAGVVEVEVLGFEVERKVFDVLPLRVAHGLHVVPLGMAEEHFYVASCTPTNDGLQRELCSQTGHTVRLVWASREAIERRLEVQDRVGPCGPCAQPERRSWTRCVSTTCLTRTWRAPG